MEISEPERNAIRAVLVYGDAVGYGNLISHLQTAWARKLMNLYGMNEKAARRSAGGPGYPFAMQDDLVERGEWDETGKRYRPATTTQKKKKKEEVAGGRPSGRRREPTA